MVSVIIPVYNGEKYIQTIVNCFEQQINNDFELIFINDGSKDNSLDELNKAKKNSFLEIVVMHQNNAGVSSSRNVGIDNAKGELLCFCDVDDEVTKDFISDMRYVIENNEVDLVICKHQLKKMDGTEKSISSKLYTGKVEIKDTITCLKDFLYGRIVSGCCTIMTRKTVIIANNLRFAEGYKYSEDLHMIWRIIAFCPKIAYLDKSLYIYKLQENSATSKFNSERLHGCTLFRELEVFFEMHIPQFSQEYKSYGVAKIMWSIAWQAAIYYRFEQFRDFYIKYNVKNEMSKLILFKNYKVALSSITFIMSPAIFRLMAIKFGKKHIH